MVASTEAPEAAAQDSSVEAAPSEALTPQQQAAQAKLDALRADGDFTRRLASGDIDALTQYRQAQSQLLEPGERANPPVDPIKAAAQAAFEPPADAKGYRFDHGMVQPDAALEAEARELFFAAALPTSTAANLVHLWNEAARGLPIATGTVDAETLALARSVLDALPPVHRERAFELLEVSGLGDSPAVIRQLATFAQARGAKRK